MPPLRIDSLWYRGRRRFFFHVRLHPCVPWSCWDNWSYVIQLPQFLKSARLVRFVFFPRRPSSLPFVFPQPTLLCFPFQFVYTPFFGSAYSSLPSRITTTPYLWVEPEIRSLPLPLWLDPAPSFPTPSHVVHHHVLLIESGRRVVLRSDSFDSSIHSPTIFRRHITHCLLYSYRSSASVTHNGRRVWDLRSQIQSHHVGHWHGTLRVPAGRHSALSTGRAGWSVVLCAERLPTHTGTENFLGNFPLFCRSFHLFSSVMCLYTCSFATHIKASKPCRLMNA